MVKCKKPTTWWNQWELVSTTLAKTNEKSSYLQLIKMGTTSWKPLKINTTYERSWSFPIIIEKIIINEN